MQLIRGKATGRHMESGTDKLGRYSWMTLHGSNAKKLCIITAYRVVQGKGSTPKSRESTTAHWQQVKAMIKEGKEAPDPRQQIMTDLTKFINNKRDDGCEIILMTDANESSTNEGSKWKIFLETSSNAGQNAGQKI